MNFALTVVHAVVAILLAITILLQHRASGLSATFGGSGAGQAQIQRRGAEKLIFRASVWLSVIFFVIPLIQWYV